MLVWNTSNSQRMFGAAIVKVERPAEIKRIHGELRANQVGIARAGHGVLRLRLKNDRLKTLAQIFVLRVPHQADNFIAFNNKIFPIGNFYGHLRPGAAMIFPHGNFWLRIGPLRYPCHRVNFQ